jgi:hypothetical protein
MVQFAKGRSVNLIDDLGIVRVAVPRDELGALRGTLVMKQDGARKIDRRHAQPGAYRERRG